jgi:hypothetical protein
MNNVMGNVRVFAPIDEDEQAEIASVIHSIDTIIDQRMGAISRKSKLKTALMQNLLTGKIRIPAE